MPAVGQDGIALFLTKYPSLLWCAGMLCLRSLKAFDILLPELLSLWCFPFPCAMSSVLPLRSSAVGANSDWLSATERGGPLACANFSVFRELLRKVHFLGIPVLLKKITTGCYSIWSRNVISQCLARKQYCISIFFCSALKVSVSSNTQLIWGQAFWNVLRLMRFYLEAQFEWLLATFICFSFCVYC